MKRKKLKQIVHPDAPPGQIYILNRNYIEHPKAEELFNMRGKKVKKLKTKERPHPGRKHGGQKRVQEK